MPPAEEVECYDDEFRLAHRKYRPVIEGFAYRNHFKLPGSTMELDLADLESELLEVLWKVVRTYDPNSGAKFNTYFWQCVGNRFKSLLRLGNAQKRQSNIETETLSAEAVQFAVDGWLTHASAEDEYLAPLMVEEIHRAIVAEAEAQLRSA